MSEVAQNLNIFATILNNIHQLGCVFRDVIWFERFCSNGFRRAFCLPLWVMAALLSYIILSQTCFKLRNDSVEDSEVDNHLDKIDFADREGRQVSCRFSSFPPILSDGLATKMAASEVASFKTNFFRIAGTSEAETSVSGKADCLLVFGKDKKNQLF